MNDDPRAEANWEGLPDGTEHRTTGGRAWCFQDSTWCYESSLCPCCDQTRLPDAWRGMNVGEVLEEIHAALSELPEDGANKSRDAGRGYSQAIRDFIEILWGDV